MALLTRNQVRDQALGLAFGVGVSVAVGVAGSLAGIESLQDVSLAGLAVTAIRSAATGLLTVLGASIPGISGGRG